MGTQEAAAVAGEQESYSTLKAAGPLRGRRSDRRVAVAAQHVVQLVRIRPQVRDRTQDLWRGVKLDTDIKRDLRALQEVEAHSDGHSWYLRTDLRGVCHQVLGAADVTVPPRAQVTPVAPRSKQV